MADPANYFCDDVSEARDRFLDLCTRTGLSVTSIRSKTTSFFCDYARLGAPSADHIIVMASGAAGSAGFVNAGLCSALLGERLQRHLGRNVAILLIHAINPDGAAWTAAASKAAQAETVPAPPGGLPWSDDLLNAADARFRAHMKDKQRLETRGDAGAERAAPAWTPDDAATIAETQIGNARFAFFLDFRTGLGGWADPSFLNTATPRDTAYTRVRRWYPGAGDGPLYAPRSPQAAGLAAHLTEAEQAVLTVEFGTFRQAATFGTLTSSDAAFDPYPKSRDWRTRVWRHAEAAILQGIGACEEMAVAHPGSRRQKPAS